MRGTVPGLVSPHPLVDTLPALYREDPIASRLCAGLDEVLAPVLLTLDCLGAHLDPRTAPEDLLPWLTGWVGLVPGPGTAPDTLRELVATAWQLSTWCGTARGVRLAVRLLVGVEPEVVESGGASWDAGPRPPLPGEAVPRLEIRLPPGTPQDADLAGLERLLAGVVPAHVEWRVVRG